MGRRSYRHVAWCNRLAITTARAQANPRSVLTLTPNPSIDLSTAVDRVVPRHKLRCRGLKRDPGGGGINVARVVHRLGLGVSAVYAAGGFGGQLLETLVRKEGIYSRLVRISAETREDFTVDEAATGQQFRFVLAGPQLEESEWRKCLDEIESTHPFPDFVVASGSLPPGAPDDFYARAARMTRERGGKLALDTSGRPLEMALAEGVYLVKPNLNELRQLTGSRSDSQTDWESWCRRIITEGQADVVALTLGDKGALLATDQGVWRAPALDISAISTVGAGDSFLGGMIWSLASNHSLETAFRYGAAAGSAALLSLGTELCHADDVVRLFPQVSLRRC